MAGREGFGIRSGAVCALGVAVVVGIGISCWAAKPQAAAVVGEAGAGWPHLRGPCYSGVSDETNLVDTWPEAGPPVLWFKEDFGQGYSGFIAAGGRVYTQTQTMYAQYVVCLDGRSGRQIWRHRYGPPYEAAGLYPGPRATPTYADGRIYFAGPRGLVGCLDAGDGRLVWSKNVIEAYGGRGGVDFGYSCTPLVEDGLVILPVGGPGACVVALDAADGSTVWQSGHETASYCPAIPITFQGRRHVVAFLENSLAAFDVKTGRQLWLHKFSQGYDEHAALPLYDEPYLMIASPFRDGAKLYRIETVPTDDADGPQPNVAATLVWPSPHLSNDVVSSVLVDGSIYGFDLRDVQAKVYRPSRGEFRCLDLLSGEVRWSTKQTGHASLIAADGKLILFNDRGELLLVRATPSGYEELARTQVFADEICWTAPALDQGRLYLRSPSRAACIYLGDASSRHTPDLAKSRSTSDIPKQTWKNIRWLIGGEREHPLDPPDPEQLLLWYLVCLAGVFVPAAVCGGAGDLVCSLSRSSRARRVGQTLFWSAALVFGIVGAPVCGILCQNYRWHDSIFTWPATLFVAFQTTLFAVTRTEHAQEARKPRRLARIAGLLFLAVCAAYYYFCMKLHMPHEWVFLIGFLPAALPASFAARRLLKPGHMYRDFVWAVVGFSVFFWAAGGVAIWKRY